LGQRSEKAQNTAIFVNAVVLAFVFLGVVIDLGSIKIESSEERTVEIVIILFVFNIVTGMRTISLESHIDIIGGYIQEIETHAYGRPGTEGLGWENYQRRPENPVKGGWPEKRRRYGIWAALIFLNCLALVSIFVAWLWSAFLE
ncbi:MAG: hypothetical protein AAFU58_09420, partial [Pseudomonadota bacterium]